MTVRYKGVLSGPEHGCMKHMTINNMDMKNRVVHARYWVNVRYRQGICGVHYLSLAKPVRYGNTTDNI